MRPHLDAAFESLTIEMESQEKKTPRNNEPHNENGNARMERSE